MRFYANENFPRPVVEALRRLGHDVLTIQEAGYGGKATPDEAVLAFAKHEKRVLLTLNRKDFLALHLQLDGDHAGIILCTADRDFQGQAQRIHESVSGISVFSGALMRVNRPNH